MPSYEPESWNDGDKVQYGNNCYDYAIGRPSGKHPYKSQPGKAHGHELKTPCTCEDVTEGALKDGLTKSNKDDACEQNCWKVALAVDPTDPGDYHWYRQDDDGKWSHKPGWGKATNQDFGDPPQEINDPETSERDRYSDFCGYFCVCPEQVTVAMVLPPERASLFANLTLREKGLLVTRGLEVELPPGHLSIWYGNGETLFMPNKITVYALIYSGRENPNWQLAEKDLETLRAKLIGLPRRETEAAPKAGYQGFYLANLTGLPNLPPSVHVYHGCISMRDAQGKIARYEDSEHLEEWLMTLAGNLPVGNEIQGALAKSGA